MKRVFGPISGRVNTVVFMAVLAAFLSIAGVGTGHAHRVMIFAWIDGDTVHTQSKFPGDRAVSAGEVTVCDMNGNPLFSGKTDEQGNFSFGLDRTAGAGDVQIKLVAGMGHQASWTLTAEEMAVTRAGAEAEAAPLPEKGKTEAEPSMKPLQKSRQVSAPKTPMTQGPGLSEADVQRIVDAALERKLSPVMGMLVAIQEKMAVGLDDVVAGIGYILGLTGIAAYAYTRGKKE